MKNSYSTRDEAKKKAKVVSEQEFLCRQGRLQMKKRILECVMLLFTSALFCLILPHSIKIPLVDWTGSHFPFEIKPTNVELGCLRQSEGISRPASYHPSLCDCPKMTRARFWAVDLDQNKNNTTFTHRPQKQTACPGFLLHLLCLLPVAKILSQNEIHD